MAERFIGTLKEAFLRVRSFETIEDLRRGLQNLATRYNATRFVALHGHRIPNQLRVAQG